MFTLQENTSMPLYHKKTIKICNLKNRKKINSEITTPCQLLKSISSLQNLQSNKLVRIILSFNKPALITTFEIKGQVLLTTNVYQN